MAAPGCGTDAIEPLVRCQSTSSTFLALDAPSPLGFTPLDVLNNAVDSYESTVSWADDMTGPIEVDLEFETDSQRYEQRSYTGDPEPGSPPCEDGVVMDMRIIMISVDGRFREQIGFTGVASQSDEMLVAFRLPGQLIGEFDINLFAPAGAAGAVADVQLRSGPNGINGDITGTANGEQFDIATITTP